MNLLEFSRMATPVVVKVSERPRSSYRKYSSKVFEDDSMGAFSSIPHGIMPTEDTRMMIRVKFEEYNHVKLIDLWEKELTGDNFGIKPKYLNVVDKRLHVWNNFPNLVAMTNL